MTKEIYKLTHKKTGAVATITFERGVVTDINIQGNNDFNQLVIYHGAVLHAVKLTGRTTDKVKLYADYNSAEGYDIDTQAEIISSCGSITFIATDSFRKFFDIAVEGE